MKVSDIRDFLDNIYPFSNKCEWDNCGLLIGDESKEISRIGFALDLTKEVLSDAVRNGVELIVTHHPVIFHAQKSFLAGNIAYEAAVKGTSVISCHTCYDSGVDGVSEILAKEIGLSNIKTVETEEKPYCVRIGNISEETPDSLALKVAKNLDTTVRLVSGGRKINKVAVCGGAGGDFIPEIIAAGADAYITGDISHHEFLLAHDSSLTLIAAGHFETEVISMKPLMQKVSERFVDAKCILLKQDNPVSFVSAED